MADTNGLGYEGGAVVFAAGLVVIAAAYYSTSLSRTLLFWAAFILTRPLGATLGDLLDKPLSNGGLAFSRFYASAIIAVIIILCVAWLPQCAGTHPGKPKSNPHLIERKGDFPCSQSMQCWRDRAEATNRVNPGRQRLWLELGAADSRSTIRGFREPERDKKVPTFATAAGARAVHGARRCLRCN